MMIGTIAYTRSQPQVTIATITPGITEVELLEVVQRRDQRQHREREHRRHRDAGVVPGEAARRLELEQEARPVRRPEERAVSGGWIVQEK